MPESSYGKRNDREVQFSSLSDCFLFFNFSPFFRINAFGASPLKSVNFWWFRGSFGFVLSLSKPVSSSVC